MKFKLLLSFLPLLLGLIGCSNSPLDQYIKKNGEKINIKVPYKVLSTLRYEAGDEPFVTCLREEYASRFGNIDMHFEHTDPATLYHNIFQIPKITLDTLSPTQLKDRIGKWYKANKIETITETTLNRYYVGEIEQTFNPLNKNLSYVVCQNRVRYILELRGGKWVIVDTGTP